MSKLILILCAVILLATVSMLDFAHAADMNVELETYKDPGGAFSVDVPKGWSSVDTNDKSQLLFLSSGLATIGFLKTEDPPAGHSLVDLLPIVIDTIKGDDEVYVDARVVEKASMMTGAKSPLAHIQIAYKMNGENSYVTDLYLAGDPASKKLYSLVTYVPAADEDSYRPLFDKIARSIFVKDAASRVSGTAKKFSLNGKSYSLVIPDGWDVEESEDMALLIQKGLASIGLFDADEDSQVDNLKSYLQETVKQIASGDTFVGLKVIKDAVMLDGTSTPVAYLRVSYKLEGKHDFVSDFYLVGDSKGQPDYGLVSYVPAAEKDLYRPVLESMMQSVTLAEEPAKESVEIETTQKKAPEAVDYAKAKALFWVRNDVQVMKDGKLVWTDEAGINDPCLSWNGQFLAYSRNQTQVIVVDLKAGKKVKVYETAGEETVKHKDSGSERETAHPVGFSADNKTLYLIDSLSSVYVGGNKLMSVPVSGGKATLVDKGVSDVAISFRNDMLVFKPGSIQMVQKSGDVKEIDPEIRSLFINGVGFTLEGKPFYYSSDNIYVLDMSGNQTGIRLNSTTIGSRPVIYGDTVIWDDGKKVVTNKDGAIAQVSKQGSNRQPFM